MNILVVGGNGGIGLACVKACLQQYPQAIIHATYHQVKPEFEHAQLIWQQLDATSEWQVAEYAKSFTDIGILINAIGVLHTSDRLPEKTVRQFESEFFLENIKRNTLPSILIAKYFAPALKKSDQSWYVALSARIGSISDNQIGGWLSYRASKAALNMAIKTIAIEWAQKIPNCCVTLFHPGTTDTPLSKPFQRNLPEGQLHSSEVTANALLSLIKTLSPKDSGGFYDFNGKLIEW